MNETIRVHRFFVQRGGYQPKQTKIRSAGRPGAASLPKRARGAGPAASFGAALYDEWCRGMTTMHAQRPSASADSAQPSGSRPRTRCAALAAALLVPVLIAGCSSAPASPAPPAGAAHYPRALHLDGIAGQQICDSLGAASLAEMSLSGGSPTADREAPGCGWSSSGAGKAGVSATLEVRPGAVGGAPDRQVAGFSADQHPASRACALDVDAAPGKVLRAEVRAVGKAKVKTKGSRLCGKSAQLADLSLQALR